MRRTLLLGMAIVALLAPAGTVAGSGNTQAGNEDWDQVLQGVPGHMDIIVGPDAIRFILEDISIEGEYAAELRHTIDTELGDRDGEVSENEVGTTQSVVTAIVNNQLPNSFDMDLVRLSGRTPYAEEGSAVNLENLQINGAEGSTTSTDKISADLSVLLLFETVNQNLDLHTLRFENVWGDVTGFDLEQAPDMEVRVQGYGSWSIVEDSIEPSDMQSRYDDGKLVFTGEDISHMEEEGNHVTFDISGTPGDQMLTESEDSPAVAPLVLLVFAFAGLAAWRRR